MNPILLVDSYKVHHGRMYPPGTTLIYSNFTPRKSRIPGIDKVVVFGIQYLIKEYLIRCFNEEFFAKDINAIVAEYNEHLPVNADHFRALHKLGYLPIQIKALEEGTLCPIGVPVLTIKNTLPEFYWLTNYLETLISAATWQAITSATIAYEYKKLLDGFAMETTGSTAGVEWTAHDFSMRGMSSVESAIVSGMGHLLSFTGSDNIPAIYGHKKYYSGTGLIGASVPATEHSVMCMYGKDDEIGTFKHLLDTYPTGLLSVVSDTWNLWDVLTKYLPELKDQIMKRDGKLVIRPDSGDPVDILCGENSDPEILSLKDSTRGTWRSEGTAAWKGVIELLWDTFGGTINDKGFKVLDSHIGAIYGDSITIDRAKQICERLRSKGFASTNVVFGVGSYTYQYNTRDTFGFAMKATYGEVFEQKMGGSVVGSEGLRGINVGREIWKDPITDDGTKKSKKGLLHVWKNRHGELILNDQVSWHDEEHGCLQTVFLNGKLTRETTLGEIRAKLKEA